MASAVQLSLFRHEEPSLDGDFVKLERTELGDGAWFDLASGCKGSQALFEVLRTGLRWRSERREMYERRLQIKKTNFPATAISWSCAVRGAQRP